VEEASVQESTHAVVDESVEMDATTSVNDETSARSTVSQNLFYQIVLILHQRSLLTVSVVNTTVIVL